MGKKGCLILAALFAALFLLPGGRGECASGGGALSAEIAERIHAINSRPAPGKLDIPPGEGAKNPEDILSSSLGLDGVVLEPEDLQEIEELRKILRSSGLGKEDMEQAIAMIERQKKMDRLGLTPADLAKAMAATAISGGGKGGSGSSGRDTAGQTGPSIGDLPLSSAADGVDGMDEEEKARWALGLGDHMAVATFYDIVDGSMLKTAGLAVSAYPPPPPEQLRRYAPGILPHGRPLLLFRRGGPRTPKPRHSDQYRHGLPGHKRFRWGEKLRCPGSGGES
ncbi:hypothetical protein MASR2M17_02670 [Aminivibrio sp.]